MFGVNLFTMENYLDVLIAGGKTMFTASQFAQCLALIETHVKYPKLNRYTTNYTMYNTKI